MAIPPVKAASLSPSADQDLTSIFKRIEERFSFPEVVSQKEIEGMYQVLFEGPFEGQIRPFLEDPDHIASMIFSLYRVIQYGETAMVSTAESSSKGINGSYFLKDDVGHSQWVFKPSSEESPCLGGGIPQGGGTLREHFASVVNYHGIYPIPFTAFVVLFGKEGSVQRVVPGKSCRLLLEEAQGLCSDDAVCMRAQKIMQNLSVRDLQAKLIFDIIFGNGDSHEGNILCEETGAVRSIDHGNICSVSEEAALCVPYMRLLKEEDPLSEDLLDHCRSLPAAKYIDLMRGHGFEREAISHMEVRAKWLCFGLSRELVIKEIALPLMLMPKSIYASEAGWGELVSGISALRQRLHEFCSQGKWDEVKGVLSQLRQGRLIPLLVRGEEQVVPLWHIYLKPLLLRYPLSGETRREIGETL